jgi:hypothetical protein
MMKQWLAGMVVWIGMAGAAGAAAEQAVVTQVRGGAQLVRQQLAPHQLGLLDALKHGDLVEVAADAELVVFLPARLQQFTLAGPASFLVGEEGVTRQRGSGSVRPERQDPAFARVLRRPNQVVAGAVVRAASGDQDGADAERIAPSMPVLAWRAQAHLGTWRLRVLDDAGRVVFEGAVAHTELTLPDSARLEPGRRYRRELRWQRRDGSMQADTTQLQALDADDDARLMRLLPPADAPLAARVLYALYLRGLGVRSLARQIAPEIKDLNLP